jgi:prolyl-tRNA synthetase
MKMSALFAPTLRETPAEAEITSHQLMLRAGMIRKVAAGIYNLLPLGFRVVRKVETIVREEMNRAGAQEVLMPAVIPAELWKESGRWDLYGHLLLRLRDRKEAEFCIGPTHEEVITAMVRSEIRSYRELPVTLYQIQTKFRDEIRPRFGLMRAREFMMKDAYSFHESAKSLDREYRNMRETYCRIFERCGLEYRVVRADSGDIGGDASEEFMVLADTGEDQILSCACGYGSNVEAAEALEMPFDGVPEAAGTVEPVHTPGQKTIEEVSAFLKTRPMQAIKTLIYKADGAPVAALIRGDHEVNEIKLKNALKCGVLEMADDETVKKVTGAETGFAGPVGLKNVRMVADRSVRHVKNGVTGANRTDYHLLNVVCGRDFEAGAFHDLRLARTGDLCPACRKKPLEIIRGIEVGHIFKLGDKYSKSMNALFLDKAGASKPFIMGCYGIGIGRTAAAAIEQRHDKDGIVWPLPLAPFKVFVTAVSPHNPAQTGAAEKVYAALTAAGVSAVLDDRDERVGVKLKDADLIGFPCKVIAGKAADRGELELKDRKGGVRENVAADRAVSRIRELLS